MNTAADSPAAIFEKVRKLTHRQVALCKKLVNPADAAVRALKDAKLTETAAALESVLFEIHAVDDEIRETLENVPPEQRPAVLYESLKPHNF